MYLSFIFKRMCFQSVSILFCLVTKVTKELTLLKIRELNSQLNDPITCGLSCNRVALIQTLSPKIGVRSVLCFCHCHLNTVCEPYFSTFNESYRSRSIVVSSLDFVCV